MNRTLTEHITYLEQRLRELNAEIMDNHKTLVERNQLQSEIWAAELALAHFHKAIDLEQRVG